MERKHFIVEAFNTLEAGFFEYLLAKIFGREAQSHEAPHLGDYGATVETKVFMGKIYVTKFVKRTTPADAGSEGA